MSYFGKREDWKWNRNDILKDHGIFYTLELQDLKFRGLKNPKMVVIFSHFGPDSINAGERTLQKYFSNIRTFIQPNSIILRIMDFNRSHGSFYLNTTNYPNFEERIQKLIATLAQKNKIKSEDIVLLGSSKGGTGALVHGLIGNYKNLSVDPIINDNYFVENKNDWHFMKGARELDFSIKIRECSEKFSRKGQSIIIANSTVSSTFREINRLSNISEIKIYDTKNKLAYENHSLVGPTAKFEMITLLNLLLNQELIKFIES
ncbi:XcbB/CpsF family capsular polysaccharide biosynthesis protein [Lactococcus formosensis]|uniref:XcbB/CpsF family capsular polysaccharide biosynthesis protein n=1 Tax=Lactococcus formosensis TaxID=1281486 RepID=UPI0024359524|nr:XcbB/CpsF family capsular polysaccharide biosynthesis protein [Lactococcus formosensis]MDG6132805.1 XcbB/CpsF family capsular polysaccharide biosynthesis protein [Lactococcus formosensis]MDG6134800.1 XcbB/CpsF family capsular polysaccharide biosynthesis protein [Lactococcus formosensis]MDG6140907.1 XcbB/CpsF family capsular polysaccharide biosynthesis protein [Lactococcus formosensis]MDG6147686.1 XcbB/CpsF family capsular polysaccharide biosynthesis protein [Lactococcus formosensis]